MLSKLLLSFAVLPGDVKRTASGAGPRNPASCLSVPSLPNVQQRIIVVLTSVQQAADKYLQFPSRSLTVRIKIGTGEFLK